MLNVVYDIGSSSYLNTWVGLSVTRLGNLLDFCKFLKPLATIIFPKSPTYLSNFCKGVKIYQFSSEISFWATFIDIWRFFLVTLVGLQVILVSSISICHLSSFLPFWKLNRLWATLRDFWVGTSIFCDICLFIISEISAIGFKWSKE